MKRKERQWRTRRRLAISLSKNGIGDVASIHGDSSRGKVSRIYEHGSVQTYHGAEYTSLFLSPYNPILFASRILPALFRPRLLQVRTMVRDAETASYRLNHTMYRIKDPQASLHFYTKVLGMEVLDTLEGGDFTLFFLAYDHSNGAVSTEEKTRTRTLREGILELTYNHGTEKDADFSYHTGNSEPRGYGHIAITVDDIHAACERFEKLGVTFQKRLTDGKMKNIAFIKDPDGYWVEILPAGIKF